MASVLRQSTGELEFYKYGARKGNSDGGVGGGGGDADDEVRGGEQSGERRAGGEGIVGHFGETARDAARIVGRES